MKIMYTVIISGVNWSPPIKAVIFEYACTKYYQGFRLPYTTAAGVRGEHFTNTQVVSLYIETLLMHSAIGAIHSMDII